MSDPLAILVPTRGRPEGLRRLIAVCRRLCTGPVTIVAGIDDDDPAIDGYAQVIEECDDTPDQAGTVTVFNVVGPRRTLSAWTNDLAEYIAAGADPGVEFLASLGDDHVPRTLGWDEALTGAVRDLEGPGWAYGNDLLQGQSLSTAWVQHIDVFTALGWVMEPTLDHMFVDNVVMELGTATGRLQYVSSVIIEHVHPAAGKAALDPSYRETNASPAMARDRGRFEAWKVQYKHRDADRVRAAHWRD